MGGGGPGGGEGGGGEGGIDEPEMALLSAREPSQEVFSQQPPGGFPSLLLKVHAAQPGCSVQEAQHSAADLKGPVEVKSLPQQLTLGIGSHNPARHGVRSTEININRIFVIVQTIAVSHTKHFIKIKKEKEGRREKKGRKERRKRGKRKETEQ